LQVASYREESNKKQKIRNKNKEGTRARKQELKFKNQETRSKKD